MWKPSAVFTRGAIRRMGNFPVSSVRVSSPPWRTSKSPTTSDEGPVATATLLSGCSFHQRSITTESRVASFQPCWVSGNLPRGAHGNTCQPRAAYERAASTSAFALTESTSGPDRGGHPPPEPRTGSDPVVDNNSGGEIFMVSLPVVVHPLHDFEVPGLPSLDHCLAKTLDGEKGANGDAPQPVCQDRRSAKRLLALAGLEHQQFSELPRLPLPEPAFHGHSQLPGSNRARTSSLFPFAGSVGRGYLLPRHSSSLVVLRPRGPGPSRGHRVDERPLCCRHVRWRRVTADGTKRDSPVQRHAACVRRARPRSRGRDRRAPRMAGRGSFDEPEGGAGVVGLCDHSQNRRQSLRFGAADPTEQGIQATKCPSLRTGFAKKHVAKATDGL